MGASNIIVNMMIEMKRNKVIFFLSVIFLLASCREAPVTERKQLVIITDFHTDKQALLSAKRVRGDHLGAIFKRL
jgi:hypothetical protein